MTSPNWTQDYLQAAENAAATYAARIARKAGMSQEERADVRQELLAHLLEKSSHYDSSRGSLGTFTGKVSQNRSLELLDRYIKDRQVLTFVSTVAANDSNTDGGDQLEQAAVIPLWSQDSDLFMDGATLHDLERAANGMSDDLNDLVELLVHNSSMADACRAFPGSPATFYRRVNELKMHLRMFGFKSAA